MTKKRTLQSRPGASGVRKKPRAHGKKTSTPAQIPSQTNQPYEHDTKHRTGQFTGAGEPPLMKK